jgi:alkanesulfonate monooxygenase SsuD/methylene tetrahydromethanopterin reductase-like flavin-dependent oxidoreductase (luciferase family)
VLRGPLPLASALVALAQLSKGRVVAGVGQGSSRADYDLAYGGFEDRLDRFDRSIEALRSLLQQESSLLGTRSVSGRDADIPVWVASWGSQAGLRRVARLGHGWMASAYNTEPDRFAAGLRVMAEERARLLAGRGSRTVGHDVDVGDRERRRADRVLVDVLAPIISRSPEAATGPSVRWFRAAVWSFQNHPPRDGGGQQGVPGGRRW